MKAKLIGIRVFSTPIDMYHKIYQWYQLMDVLVIHQANAIGNMFDIDAITMRPRE
jgi:hypothetical protein